MRRGKWKLLFDRAAQPLWWFYGGNPNASRTRLFDITVDGREWADLSDEHRDVVEELFNEWHDFDESLLAYDPPRSGQPIGEAD